MADARHAGQVGQAAASVWGQLRCFCSSVLLLNESSGHKTTKLQQPSIGQA
jgi:hypothetical protein